MIKFKEGFYPHLLGMRVEAFLGQFWVLDKFVTTFSLFFLSDIDLSEIILF